MKKALQVLLLALLFALMITTVVSAKTLEVDSKVESSINSDIGNWLTGKETDTYEFVADETQYYRFSLKNHSVTLDTGDNIGNAVTDFFTRVRADIYDKHNEVVGYTWAKSGYTGTLSLKLTAGEKYTIKVYAESFLGQIELFTGGAYTLSNKKLADIGGDSWSDAVETEATNSVVSAIDASGDKDWFKFSVDNTASFLNVSLEGIQSSKLTFSLYEYVSGAGETPLREAGTLSVNSNSKGSKTFILNKNSTYYYNITSSGTSGYVLNAAQIEDMGGTDFDDAKKVALNTQNYCSFEGPKDSDYIKFETGNKLAYYQIKMILPDDVYGSTILLYDEAGELLASAESGYNLSAVINYQLEENTTYFVKFYAPKASNYEFYVNENVDTYPDEMSQAKEVSLNETYKTSFDAPEDIDYIKFETGNKLAYYQIKMMLPDDVYGSTISLYNEAGELLASAKSGYDLSIVINYQLEKNTTYFVGFYAPKASNFEFFIKEILDEDADSQDKGSWINYNIEYKKDLSVDSDVDWFKINVTEGTALYVTLYNESCNTLYCNVYSERDVKVISIGGYGSPKKYNKSATLEGGTYYINVNGKAGYYRLTLSRCGNGHNEVTLWGKAATCTETGLTDGKKCADCGAITVAQKEIKTTSHNFQNGVCRMCGLTEKCKNGHTPVKVDAVAATCKSRGVTEGAKCSVCDKILEGCKSTNMLSHQFKKDVCTVCGMVDLDVLQPMSFYDVKYEDWYSGSVWYVTAKGLFNGTSENRFSPNDVMTRAMLVTVLWRSAGSPKVNSVIAFSDVDDLAWYADAIKWATRNQIVNGVGEGVFNPNGNITREQMATILYRYASSINADIDNRTSLHSFPDFNEVSTWAKESVEWAVANGFINGTTKSGYSALAIDGGGNATRAQVATILTRFLLWVE